VSRPPGSGKTKTIVAIVGAILSDSFRNRGTAIQVPGQPASSSASKKLLVCAPSNAAVDELVMRFKHGIKSLHGEEKKVNIVRLGRGDAINVHVQDVTLENLVSKKLGMNTSNTLDPEATKKLFQEHKDTSEQLRRAQDQMSTGEVKGAEASKLQDDIHALRRQKALLGTKIDNTKDAERLEKRNAELGRRRAQEQVLNDAHIICGTLSGSGHDMFQNLSIEFETVIVDEAAQCVEMSALIPLKYGCAKCILVGDPKQLPPTVFSKKATVYQYEQSLFARMEQNHPDDIHLLDTQYRMHPEISYFPSQTFYDSKLQDGGDMAALRKQPWHSSVILGPYRFFDVKGQQQSAHGHSLINIAEIRIAMRLYQRLTSDYPSYDFRGKVGIITPYKSQLKELRTRFTAEYGPGILESIEFNTTDAFQGRESEVIIFSCVRASPRGNIGFLQDIRRMNVGLTRAKSSLWVLGNSESLMRGQFWNQLIVDAKQRQRYTDGDLDKMLRQHSSQYPARPGMFDVPMRPSLIKQEIKAEPMSRQSSESDVNARIKQELPYHPTNGKRKHSGDSNDTEMVDADMEDGNSEPAPNMINSSGTSTPAHHSDSAPRGNGLGKDSATPEPTAARPGDAIGALAKPKIMKKRRREGPNPLVNNNKRPKP
jgi:senataxin